MHVSHGAAGGAGRAGRRAHLATRAAGLLSAFAFLAGEAGAPDDILLRPRPPELPGEAALAKALHERVQWGVVQSARRAATNTLFSIAHPALALEGQALFDAADVIHLHWTSWAVSPATLRHWLAAGRQVVWTLHDLWPMTGGCHYPAGCEQYRTACLQCPQLADAWSLVPNAFAEKRAAWSAPGPVVVAPSAWMAARAAESAILRGCRIETIPNAVETDAFAPQPDRDGLRAAWGLAPQDLLLVAGAHDNREARKGGALLMEALHALAADGRLAALLPPGAQVAVAGFGKSALPPVAGLRRLDFGEVAEDAVLADILGASDLACIPSLEDNYPNVALEALACGTPCLATPVGGLPELVREGSSGVLAGAATAEALAEALLRFVARHHGDAGLRASARAQVEAENAIPVVGARLAALYRDLAGGGRATDAAAHGRALRAFAQAPVEVAAVPGAPFLRFPANLLLRDAAGPAVAGVAVAPAAPPAPGALRVMALRAQHAHHGARSGPWQFLRHLPEGIDAAIRATPLGATLAGIEAGAWRDWGRLLGTVPFGQQGNAWLAETEILAECADARFDLVHAIDGELALWLLPRIPPALFQGGRRPAMAATFHQPPALLAGMVNPALLAALDAVVVLCEAQRSALAGLLPPERLHVIPHGIDAGFFTPAPQAPGDGFRLLAVGHWLRDFETLFATLALLRGAGLDARLRIVSPNPPRGVPAGVEVEAGLPDEALREAYRDADALLLPLTDATANNAILEAMACGRPVVSTDVGGVAEMTAGAALVGPPGDARALADAVLSLAGNRAAAAALGRAARARAEALDWPHIAARHAALYAAIAGARA
ncbi:glycosyltransferase [Roseomonas sp. CECT 9278]|uniref:glycosyltransferase n=1 Tax=Roseomonas sp. CECT 9278 TaxID=2845823 RepID=UPI001E329A54|nr:glycosyltransferase [Roseomonas sp. CECT 9278]CAH0231111.1 D-inositol-3-phosphate glycosyltransferase [Roseomonas sp. CECT 9278]